MRLRLTLLGGFDARLEDGRPVTFARKTAMALLAYLAMTAGRVHPRDKVAAMLWSDVAAEAARHNLRQALLAIRRAVPADIGSPLVSDRDGLGADTGALVVDVHEFEALAAGDTPEALAQAASIYRGDLLAGLGEHGQEFEDWLLTERARLHELAIDALARLLRHQVGADLVDPALRTAVQLLALDPLQEAVHRTMMRLYATQGRRAAALAQYQACLAALRRELGVEPEPETRELFREILQRRPEDDRAAGEAGAGARRERRPAVEASVDEAPLIGRDEALARLRETLTEAGAGRPRVIVLVGEAGIGKTRLASELATHALADGWQVLNGRCYESEQILPFAPWVSAFRDGDVLAIPGVATALVPAARAALARVLPELHDAPAPDVAHDPDNPLAIFDGLTTVLDTAAAQERVLVVLDDLHWADDMSLRFLAFAGRRLSRARVMILGTAREEALADAGGLRRTLGELGREARGVSLALGPLSEADTRRLARSAAGGADAATASRLGDCAWAASEGNPFVALETVRAIQDGSLEPPAHGVALAGRVREVVARRLDDLGESSRHLLAIAAVIGSGFEFPLLRHAAGVTELVAAEGLEELVRRRLIAGSGERFQFVHDRIRRVVDDRLLPARRQALHVAVGEALERVYAGRLESVYDRLAYHYAQTDRSAKAVEYLARFAEKAAHGGGHEEAVAALDQALAHVALLPAEDQDPRRLDLVLRKGRSLFFLGRFADALKVLVPEAPRIEARGDPRLAATYYFRLGTIHAYAGEHERAIASAGRALGEARRSDDRVTMGKAHFLLSLAAFWARPVDGVEHGRRAVDLLEKAPADESWWLGQAWWILGLNLSYRGCFAEALAAEARALAMGTAIADRRLESYAHWTTGFIQTLAGESASAIAACRRSVELAVDPLNTMTALGMLGLAYVEAGDAGAAAPVLAQALPLARRFRIPQLEGLLLTFAGQAAHHRGDVEQARALARQGLEVTRAAGYEYGVGWTERVLGRIDRAAGDHAGARARFERALATFTAMGAPFEAGRTHVELAALLASDDPAAAAVHAARAHELFTALGLPRFIACAERVVS